MAKKRVFLFVTLIMMMAFTVSAYAINYTGEGKQRGKTYNISQSGINSSFNAVGTKSYSNTRITNNASYKIYVVATVQCYNYGNGIYSTMSDERVVEAGVQLTSGNVSRLYNNGIYDFIHYSETYASTAKSSATKMDTYSYTAMQYYR